MSSSAEEEEVGPSVDSTDKEERIAARRIRIKKRLEAQKRAQMGEDPSSKKEVKEEMSKSLKQMDASRQRLTKLRDDGLELASNIRVAGDAREGQRRLEEEDARRQRRERLEAEAKAGAERFEEITKKWESALQKEIPQDLYEMLMQQKAACDAMIDEKNKVINEFQQELKHKDDRYVKDLKKQGEDIDLLIERMDEQVKQLTKAYRQELDQIEKAFVAERTELLDGQKKRWEGMMQSRRDKEVEFMHAREKRVEDFEKQLQQLRVQDAEEYNSIKIQLETDVQILEQQLQQMRATYQLNQEKLEYNFQVLRKRDEENTITKSQQKRKITRLQDVNTNLRIKLAKQEKQYRDDNMQLTEDYKRITDQFKELQKKSKHFISTDTRKFQDIWIMNEEEAKGLLEQALEGDQVVSEHLLGLKWDSPDVEFTKNIGPLSDGKDKTNAISAHQIAQEVLTAAAEASGPGTAAGDGDSVKEGGSLPSVILQRFSPKLVKTILELLCDESGFLIESKLNTLLSPLERDEQSLMKLDAIFSALGIDTEDDVHTLANYMVAHLDKKDKTDQVDQASGPSNMPSSRQRAEEESVDKEVERVTGTEGDEHTTRRSSKTDMADLIHPNEVLKALRTFVEENKEPIKDKGRAGQFMIGSLEERDETKDAEYWAKYPEAISEGRERLRDALLGGLEKYNDILGERTTLIGETDSLRQQNAELRMLLHQYVNSKVNQELEIPPTKVLQMEMNPHY